MRFSIFGRELIVERRNDRWVVFYPGEGKRRPADIIIPPQLAEEELLGYLADLLHEFARPGQQVPRRLS